ncbi:MAG: tRNA (adenosine(37)-N6)-threonylcarbamoyltransferase complex ATPase subunit type 1 TsaE [Clostridia bacterium]
MEKSKFLKSKITWQFSTAYLVKIALLTAIAFILYAFCKFPLPFAFPSFLDIQFSELPALLAGFSMGPISGCIVVVLKCLFKLPMSSTAYVGELTDIVIGIAFVLPSSLIYRRHKDKKHAAVGLAVGSVIVTALAILMNRYISIPFFIKLFFGGNFEVLLGVVRPLYQAVTIDNFYAYYLGVGVLPFNLLRCLIVSALTFMLYKRLSKILHWDGHSLVKKGISGEYECDGVEETYALASRIAKTLVGGEILLLNGDLGAGKTTFTKGLAKALGVTEEITSPTFTILNVYESGRVQLNHLDMYRIECEDDLVELGIEETIASGGVTVVEWNKLENLTGRIIDVKIETIGEQERKFTVCDSLDTKKKAKSDSLDKKKRTKKKTKSDSVEASKNTESDSIDA